MLGPAYWRTARFVFFALACATGLGVSAFLRAPQSIFPAIELARVEVFADCGDLVPERLVVAVAHPLAATLATMPGLRTMRAYVDTGKLEIELDFDPRDDVGAHLRDVRASAEAAARRLPITHLTTLVEGPDLEPVVTFALRSASASQADLREALERATLPAFAGAPGLERVAVFGGPRRAYLIDLDGAKLARAGLDARAVADAVRAAAEPHGAGTLARGSERFDVAAGGLPSDAATLADVPVWGANGRGPVRLGALGNVRTGEASLDQQASFDATRAVLLSVYGAPGADAVALQRSALARMTEVRRALPRDATIDVAWDQTRPILASQAALRVEMLLGAALALAVIFFFLRDRTLVAIAALLVPATFALTALVIARAGLSLNVMTLGGLAVAVGLVIDEAIVVVEAIARELAAEPDRSRRAAIGRAVRRIARPLLTATAANVVVFLPLGLLSGVPGFFFRALSITLAVALTVSIVLSLGVAPLLADALGARSRTVPAFALERVYVRLQERALSRGLLVYAGAGLVLALSLVLGLRLGTDFLPSVDEGQFEIKYALPPGMSLAAADAVMTRVERAIAADPGVAHEARLSGVDTNGYLATPPDAGTIRVLARANAPPFDTLAERLRKAALAENPNLYIEIHQLLEDQINDLSGAPEPVQVTVRGPDQSVLEQLADRIADRIDDVPGVVDTFDGIVYQARTIDASPLAPNAPDARDFADTLRARVGGLEAGDVAAPGGPLPAIVRLAGDGPLGRHVRLSAPRFATEIQEENGVRLVRVTAGIENASLSSVIAKIRHNTAYLTAHLPPGYSVELGGAVDAQRSAFREFALVFIVAIGLVFAVLLLAFDSFALPLVVLAAVAVTPLGVVVALLLTGTTLNVASFMGFLLLIGIVVRNGILLVDGAKRRQAAGTALREALAAAGVERLRPILMTTVATLGALAPLALGAGAGSELERPLAVAVIGGIVSATAFSLILIPVLYASVDTARRRSGIAG
jgi:multidrug efflux pump subunit AcrB